MKTCVGSGEEVIWVYSWYENPTRCRVCKQFVDYKVIEKHDGFADVALRHYRDGSPMKRLATGKYG